MVLLVVLIAAGLGWMLFTGRIARPDMRQMGAMVAALVGAAVAARGNMVIGGGMAIAGLVWLMRKPAPVRQQPQSIEADPRTREALDLLGLPPNADRTAVMEAHRRLIARNHPDAGGTEALARNINAARDYLLGRLPK